MDMEEPSPDHSTFSLNRERLLEHEVAKRFFVAVVEQARKAKLMSNEHFTVDGTLIDAWASLKSFRPKDEEKQKPPDDPGNPTVNFHGEARSNETHASTTDPEARLAKKGHNREARLSYLANALMENRNGLLVDFCIEPADGRAERRSAEQMLERVAQRTRTRLTVGADKGYDAASFIERCRQLGITPHVAQTSDSRRRSAVDGRTARHAGYAVSQRIRKRVEEIFGWMKTVGGFRKTRYRGRDKTQLAAYLVGAAYNLMRIARLQPT
jgi:Transposase and inactivated derivatives